MNFKDYFLVTFTFFSCIITWVVSDFSSADYFIFINDKDSTTTNVNIGENATVNVTTNDGKLSVQVNHINRLAVAVSATGGATVGFSVAKYIGGPPAVKVAAGVATAIGVQATTAIMSKVLGGNNGKSSNLVCTLNDKLPLNDYPLNLLADLNILLICALVFLYIIFNIYICKYIINKNLIKYIPSSIQNNKLGKFFILWLNRYLNLWSKSSNSFLGFCYFMLFIFIGVCKFALYIILSS